MPYERKMPAATNSQLQSHSKYNSGSQPFVHRLLGVSEILSENLRRLEEMLRAWRNVKIGSFLTLTNGFMIIVYIPVHIILYEDMGTQKQLFNSWQGRICFITFAFWSRWTFWSFTATVLRPRWWTRGLTIPQHTFVPTACSPMKVFSFGTRSCVARVNLCAHSTVIDKNIKCLCNRWL